MTIPAEMEGDMAEAETDLGSMLFTWRMADYSCVPTGIERGVIIDDGGNPIEVRAQLIVRRSLFAGGNEPSSGDLVTFDSRVYRITSVENIYGALLRLVLVDPNS